MCGFCGQSSLAVVNNLVAGRRPLLSRRVAEKQDVPDHTDRATAAQYTNTRVG